MRLFKSADEELDIEESNIENRLREFTLEDPDEFIDVDSEEETALIGDKRKLYTSIHTRCATFADTEFVGTVPLRNDHENGHGGRLLLGSGGLTCGGRSCNATSSLETVTLLCSILRPTRMRHLLSSLSARGRHKPYRRGSLDANDGRRPQRRTIMLPTRHSLG